MHQNALEGGSNFEFPLIQNIIVSAYVVRDSSAVRRLSFSRLAGAVGRQRALHTENSGFAHATLPWHISMFHGYQILFSIRNPFI
jgi:hypothetical protein